MLKILANICTQNPNRRALVLAGCLASSVAYLLFCIQDLGVSQMAKSASIAEILFVRSCSIICLCLAVGRTQLLRETRVAHSRFRMVLRAGLIVSAWYLFYDASRYMPFSNLMVIYHVSPMIVVVLSFLILGEKLAFYSVACVIVGFAGASLSAGTTADLGQFLAPSLAALAAAALWAGSVVLMRQIAGRAPILVQIFVTSVTMLALSLPMVRLQELGWKATIVTAILGLASACGQWLIIYSARILPAAVMASLEYVSIFWAFLLAIVLLGDTPHASAAVGAALVCISGIAVAIREAYRETGKGRVGILS